MIARYGLSCLTLDVVLPWYCPLQVEVDEAVLKKLALATIAAYRLYRPPRTALVLPPLAG